MAEGKDSYAGLAVPLQGNFEITGQSTSYDIMTLTQAAAGASDFIVCQTANGTEVFVVEDAGNVTIGGGGLTVTSGGLTVTAGDLEVTAGDVQVANAAGGYLRFSSAPLFATAPTTAMTLGDFFVFTQTSIYYLGFEGDTTSVVWDAAMTNNSI